MKQKEMCMSQTNKCMRENEMLISIIMNAKLSLPKEIQDKMLQKRYPPQGLEKEECEVTKR